MVMYEGGDTYLSTSKYIQNSSNVRTNAMTNNKTINSRPVWKFKKIFSLL